MKKNFLEITNGTGPSNKRRRTLLPRPEDDKRSFASSLKKALASLGGSSRVRRPAVKGGEEGRGGEEARGGEAGGGGRAANDFPSTFTKDWKGMFPTSKCCCNQMVSNPTDPVVQDPDDKVMPDLSNLCAGPNECTPNECLHNKTNLAKSFTNIINEHFQISLDTDSYHSITNLADIIEPTISNVSVTEFINSQFDIEEFDDNDDDMSEWSFSHHDDSGKSNDEVDEDNHGKANNDKGSDGKKIIDEANNHGKTNDDKKIDSK